MKMLKKMKNKKGFTLIELIVVIAVIAILAAILLPRFLGFSDSAKQKAVLSDARNIAVSVQAIIAEKGVIPAAAVGNANSAAAVTLVKNYLVGTAGTTAITNGLVITNVDGSFTLTRTAPAFVATYTASSGVIAVTP